MFYSVLKNVPLNDSGHDCGGGGSGTGQCPVIRNAQTFGKQIYLFLYLFLSGFALCSGLILSSGLTVCVGYDLWSALTFLLPILELLSVLGELSVLDLIPNMRFAVLDLLSDLIYSFAGLTRSPGISPDSTFALCF